MDLIEKWLKGKRNFHVGAVLYAKFGADPKLKKLFSTPVPDKLLQQKLEKELSALLEKPKVVLQQPPQNKEAAEMPRSDNAVLEAIREQWVELYQKMNYLRHELDRYPDNTPDQIAIRKEMAERILALEQSCMKLWERRDQYVKHGQLPEVKPVEKPMPQDPVELSRAISTAERNIRRNKKALRDNPGNPIYAIKVQQYEAELARLTKSKSNESPGEQTRLEPGPDTTLPGK